MIDFLVGPIIGAIGGVATQWFALKSKGLDIEDRKNEREFKRAMALAQHQMALELQKAEAAAADRKVVLEGEVAAQQADLANLNAAMSSLPRWSGIQPEDSVSMRWFKVMIEAAATMVRVTITVWVAWKVGVLSDDVLGALQKPFDLTQQQQADMVMLIAYSFLEIASTVILFWYGSRSTVLREQIVGQKRNQTGAQ